VRGVGGKRRLDVGDSDPSLRRLALLAESGADRLAVKTDLLALTPPYLPQALGSQIAVLRLPRRQGRDLPGPGAGPLPRRLEDFLAAGGEGAQVVGVEAPDLGDAVLDLVPADAETAGQLVAKMGLVDVAGGFGVVVDRRVVEPGPAALGKGGVGDEDMGVELRVAGARGTVDVAGGEEAVALDEDVAPGAASGPAGGVLEVVETRPHRLCVGGFDLGGDGMATERPGKRDRLRRREGEIEAGDGAALDLAESEGLAACRVRPGQHRDELVGIDLALQAEILSLVAEPVALGLPLARVVVLGAFGDLAEVVALLASSHLPDGEHQC